MDAINNLCDAPLVLRTVGGKRGDGISLTPRAQRRIALFNAATHRHRHRHRRWRWMRQPVASSVASVQDVRLMAPIMNTASARSRLLGNVVGVEKGSENDAVKLEIQHGQRMVPIVTRKSARGQGLKQAGRRWR